MKTPGKPFRIIALVTIIVCTIAACEFAPEPAPAPIPTPNPNPNTNQTPVAGDYIFTNMVQTADYVIAAGITPIEGKSSGARTIYYAGVDGTIYEKRQTPPQEIGKYAVTFNVAAVTGWNAAIGLSAGNLEINTKSTPDKSDYLISKNLTQTVGSNTDIIVRAKEDKSPGKVTVFYEGVSGTTYAKSTTLPTEVGKYFVTFNVEATGDWNPATFIIGTLTINSTNQNPVESDYEFRNLIQFVGSVTPVIIIPKAGKSPGAITIYYNKLEGATYAKSIKLPSAVGEYAITFDVAAASGWDEEEDLDPEITLIINKGTPTATNFKITNTEHTYDGNPKQITIVLKEGLPTATVTNIKYNDSDTAPVNAGTYPVTFNVAGNDNWYAASLTTSLAINKRTPVAGDYDIGNLTQTADNVIAVTITSKAGKSNGAISNIRYNDKDDVPQTSGTYDITFDVAESTDNNWKAVNGLKATSKLNITD
jgi:hypothetical protein